MQALRQETIIDGVERRKRMQFPLGEVLHALREFQEVVPNLKSLPKRMMRLDQEFGRINKKMDVDFLLVEQYKLMNKYQMSDLQAIVDNVAT